jgi:hypothetical protein
MTDQKIHAEPVRETGEDALGPAQGAAALQELVADVLPAEEAMARRRRQTPMGEPLPITFRWVAKLPRRVRPLALLRHYPRIANMMAGMWQDPQSYCAYVHDLLTDRRGNRKGFSPEIVQELLALRVHYEHLHPGLLDAYKDANRRA